MDGSLRYAVSTKAKNRGIPIDTAIWVLHSNPILHILNITHLGPKNEQTQY
jgi:rRNA processing protein Krr1/Pno1